MIFRSIKFYIAAMLAIFAASCTHDTLKEKHADTMQAESNQELQIVPIEDALALLDNFLDRNYPATKAEPKRKISTVSAYYGEEPLTKSDDNGKKIKVPKAYMVNFEGEKGFAVLGANNKVPDIVAVTESGIIKEDLSVVMPERKTPINLYEDGDDSDFDEVPADNYCAEDDDYYTALEVYRGARVSPNEFISALIRHPLKNENHHNFDAHTDSSVGSSNGTGDSGSSKEDWKTFTEKEPLMNLLWGQEEPYNRYCSRKKRNVAVGCSNIALAMIMTTNEFPTNMYVNGNRMDWKAMKKGSIFQDVSDEAQEDISRLVWCIFRQVKKLVTKGGTLITPRQIRKRMEEYGYENVVKLDALGYTHKMSRAISDMLAGNKPVFMSGIPGIKFRQAHSWVVDGAKYAKKEEDNYLLHCNWGWKGTYNGYFSCHCLKPTKAYEYDDLFQEQSNGNRYNCHMRVITYDIPSWPVSRSNFVK